MIPQLTLSVFASMAGISIGAWIMLFFQSARIAVLASVSLCVFAAFGTAVIEKLFGSNKQAIVFADHGVVWLIAFSLSSIVFYHLRPSLV